MPGSPSWRDHRDWDITGLSFRVVQLDGSQYTDVAEPEGSDYANVVRLDRSEYTGVR